MKTRIHKVGFEIEGEWGEWTGYNKLINSYGGEIGGDGSLSRCTNSDHYDWSLQEYKSPPLVPSNRKIRQIFALLHRAKTRKAFHWNRTCGFHIHVSFRPKLPPEIISSQFREYFLEQFKRKYPSEYEKRKKNRYCIANIPLSNDTIVKDKNGHGCDRYKAVNFCAYHKYKTIEIRLFPMATPLKLHEYLRWTIRTINTFIRKENLEEIEDIKEDELIKRPSHILVDELIKHPSHILVEDMEQLNEAIEVNV